MPIRSRNNRNYHRKSVDLQMDKFIKDLDLLLKIQPGRALFDGADIMADELTRQIEHLPVRTGETYTDKNGKERKDDWKLPAHQVQALLEGKGISRARIEGDRISIRIGFKGYDEDYPTDRYPLGFPLSYLVRSLEHGTSFRKPIPIVSNTVKISQNSAQEAMANNINEQIIEITRKDKKSRKNKK